jgi:hypothetical protein
MLEVPKAAVPAERSITVSRTRWLARETRSEQREKKRSR